MNADIVLDLVRAGHSDVAVARRLRMRTSRVSDIRRAAGIPAVKPGPKPSTAEERFGQTAQPTNDGHLLWPQTTPVIRPRSEGRKRSTPAQIAFRIRWGREPVGLVLPGCDRDGCIHPDHVEDQPMRETYRAIFGKEAA